VSRGSALLAVGIAFAQGGCVRSTAAPDPGAVLPTTGSPAALSGLEIDLAPHGGATHRARQSPAIVVTPDRDGGHPTEVLAVIDFHSSGGHGGQGFRGVRRRAAALGADTVIDAEFEHGEAGGLSHLSGLAVRAR